MLFDVATKLKGSSEPVIPFRMIFHGSILYQRAISIFFAIQFSRFNVEYVTMNIADYKRSSFSCTSLASFASVLNLHQTAVKDIKAIIRRNMNL